MRRLILKAKVNLPYFMGALTLICGIAVYLNVDFARLCEKKYLPMLQQSMDWPASEGLIKKHSITMETTGQYSHSPKTHYYGEIDYEYKVKEKSYNGFRICFHHSNCRRGTDKKDAEGLLNEYPLKSKNNVYYDPKNPAVSTLQRGTIESIGDMKAEIYNSWFYAILFFALSIITFIITIRTAKEFKR